MKKAMAGLAAIALGTASVAAAAQEAPLARDAATIEQSEEFAGNTGLFVVLAFAAAIVAIAIISNDDNDSMPTSP